MNPKTKLMLHLKWHRFVYEINKFKIRLVFGRWDNDAKVKIWEREHGYDRKGFIRISAKGCEWVWCDEQ